MGISLPMYFVVLSPNVVCGTLYVLNVVTVLSTFFNVFKMFYLLLSQPRRRLCDQVGLPVILSVYVSASYPQRDGK